MNTTDTDFRQEQLDQYHKATSFCKPGKHIWVWARSDTTNDEPDDEEFCCCGHYRWGGRYLIEVLEAFGRFARLNSKEEAP